MAYSGETSMKAVGNSRDEDAKLRDPLIGGKPGSRYSGSNDCCFGHCTKSTDNCNGRVTCFTWKRTFDKIVCCASVMVLLSLLFAIVVPLVFHKLEVDGIKEEVVIDGKDAPAYDIWQSNLYGHGDKPEIHYDVYIFDLQNPQATLNGSKPIVTERGPYAFHEYYNKFDISWSDGGNIVSYRSQRFYVFDAARTGAGLSLDDRVTIPYGTVIGFEFLLQEIPEETEQMLDAKLEEVVNGKLAQIEAGIDQKEQEVINDPTINDKVKNATLAELEKMRLLVEVVAYVSQLRRLLLTILLNLRCNLFVISEILFLMIGY